MTQFTANDVRELAKHMESVGWRPDSKGDPECYDEGAARSAEILFAFADLLEAREKAVPVAWRANWPGWRQYHDEMNPLPESWDDDAPEILPLYTHPAQAQPPAARVTDAVFPNHRACVPYENHPGKRIVGFVIDESHPWWGKFGLTEPLSALEAALAAQENPNG